MHFFTSFLLHKWKKKCQKSQCFFVYQRLGISQNYRKNPDNYDSSGLVGILMTNNVITSSLMAICYRYQPSHYRPFVTLKWCSRGREKVILRAFNNNADPWSRPWPSLLADECQDSTLINWYSNECKKRYLKAIYLVTFWFLNSYNKISIKWEINSFTFVSLVYAYCSKLLIFLTSMEFPFC